MLAIEALCVAIRIAKKRNPEVFNFRKGNKESAAIAPPRAKNENAPSEPDPLLKRLLWSIWRVLPKPFKLLGGLGFGWLFSHHLKKTGFAASFAVAERFAATFSDEKEQKAGRRPTFYRRIKYWVYLNYWLCILDMYLKKNNLTPGATRRTCILCCRLVRAVLSDGQPEKAFAQLLDFATARRRDIKWGYFNKTHGGLFSAEVQEIIIVVLQFGPECSKVLFGSFRQLTEKVDPEVKQLARDIRDGFLETTGLTSIAQAVSRSILRLLGSYCERMRKDAKKFRNRELLAMWDSAQQSLFHLSSHSPIPENDALIKQLVHEFANRANLAGAATFATREIDEEDNNYEVTVSMAARILHISSKTVLRWENPDGKHPCPVPGYDKKLRLKESAFRGWAPKYTLYRDMNKKKRQGGYRKTTRR